MRTIHRTIVSALIFSKDGKLLMGMKDKTMGGVYSDCWHIPGGGIEEGEHELTALKRELIEEVGIDTTNQKVTLVDDTGSGVSEKILKDGERVSCEMNFHVYRVDLDTPSDLVQTKLSDDLIKVRWVDFANLSHYKLTPPSQKLFARLGLIKI